MVLTTAMAESYPPQPGGPTMPVTGLDLDDLVGLSTTVGQADVAAATWTNYLVVLEGNVTDGTLEVTGTPTVVQAITPELRLRFSTVTAPLVSGNSEWFAFDLRNVADQPLELTFATSQETEVVLSQGGVEKYRWSSDTSFTQSIKTVALQPGRDLWRGRQRYPGCSPRPVRSHGLADGDGQRGWARGACAGSGEHGRRDLIGLGGPRAGA